MRVSDAFVEYQKKIDPPTDQERKARRRVGLFTRVLGREADIRQVIPSGSFARRTQYNPIHDVDLIAVFRKDANPGWDKPGRSAGQALTHLSRQVTEHLGAGDGPGKKQVWEVSERNHAVRCRLDHRLSAGPFTVDVMPALRRDDGTLRVPEAANMKWITTDPLLLIHKANLRIGPVYTPLVRVIKRWGSWWGEQAEVEVRSLLLEVLALKCLTDKGERSDALRAFFTSAAARIGEPILDPAHLCGPIQPDLDVARVRPLFDHAVELATRACAAESRGRHQDAIALWGQMLPGFPWSAGSDSEGPATGGIPRGADSGDAERGGEAGGAADRLDAAEAAHPRPAGANGEGQDGSREGDSPSRRPRHDGGPADDSGAGRESGGASRTMPGDRTRPGDGSGAGGRTYPGSGIAGAGAVMGGADGSDEGRRSQVVTDSPQG